MKTITIEISDSAWKKIKQAMMVRKLSGMTWGICEEMVDKILTEGEAGKTLVTLKTKDDVG